MIGNLRRSWMVSGPGATAQAINMPQQKQAMIAFRTDSDQWTAFVDHASRSVLHRMTQVTPSDDTLIPDLHAIACQYFHKFFPKHAKRDKTDVIATTIIMNKWQHRRAMLQIQTVTLPHLFKAWWHTARFQCLKRQAQSHAKQVRLIRFMEVTESATAAATRHDSHALFQIINKFTPKQAKRRMQLRNPQGHIANPIEEAAMLRQFIKETWQGPTRFPFPSCHLTGLPFTVEELEQALRAIPIGKAVARPCAPGIVWKSMAPLIAPALHSILSDWWLGDSCFIPSWFKDSWMILIPKPNKPPVHPRALRPLALQEPVGKAVIGILASKVQTALMPDLTAWPIWSYLPMRSTQDALLRVAQHCCQTRSLLVAQRSTPASRAQGLKSHKVAGGLCIFLDIERAFDMVSRPQLFSKLQAFGIPPPIAKLLTLWHQETGYYLYTQGADEHIAVGRGLRQGCKAAPILWNLLLLIFMSELNMRVSPQWIHDCLNFYADDGQMGGTFCSQIELQQLMTNICITLHLLQELGMTINSAKCTALLAMKGSTHRALKAQLTAKRDGKAWIKLHSPDLPVFWIPLANHAKYLGVIMTYGQLEDRTLNHRIQLSNIAFGRLGRWLKGKRGLPFKHRLRLWTTCVYPILSYGICSVGFTQMGLNRFQQHMHGMLRQLLQDHSFLTGNTHQQAFQKHGIAPPLAWLLETVNCLIQSATQRLLYVTPQDIVCSLNWTHLHELKHRLESQLHAGHDLTLDPAPSGPAWPDLSFRCHLCAFTTQHVATFRRHCTTAHNLRMNRTLHTNPALFMQHGLPQCKYCNTTFTTWRSFYTHIQRGCQVLQAGPDLCWPFASHAVSTGKPLASLMFAPKVDAPVRGQTLLSDGDLLNIKSQERGGRVLAIVQSKNWHHMKQERAACEYLASRCLLCDQFLGRTQELNHHLKTLHPEFWPSVSAKGKQLTQLHGDEVPCPYCHAMFQNIHQCTVWTQLALLMVYGGGETNSEGHPNLSKLTCEICHMTCGSPEQLHAHLARAHQLISSSFNPARDSLAGEPACNHCGALFESLESLRSHVNQGRCKKFDPDLPTEVLAIQDTWIDATCHGMLADKLREAHTRLQLTLRCQSCSGKYSRAADMAGHLQSAHAELWSASQPLTHAMIELYYETVGCCCNPSVHNARANHVCIPLRQLAMQHMRIPKAIFFPNTPTEEDLAMMISPQLPRHIRFHLERIITNRNFAAFWNDRDVMNMMRSTCLLCAEDFHVGELALHLHEVHRCGTSLVKFYVTQLLPLFLQECEHDHQCFACHQVINHHRDAAHDMPDMNRHQVVQVHLRAQCPCLLQSAILLNRATHGRLAHGGHRGRHQSGLADLQRSSSHAGQNPEADAECSAQASKKRRTQPKGPGKQPGRSEQSQPGSGLDVANKTDPSAGQGPPGAEKGGHLHFLFRQQRQREQSAQPDAGDRDMGTETPREPEGREPHQNDASAPAPPAGFVQRAPDQDRTAGECPGGLRSSPCSPEQSDPPEGQHMPVCPTGSYQESPGCQQQETTQFEEAAPTVHRPARGHGGHQHGDQVSCPADGGQTECLPMETPGESAPGHTMDDATRALQFSNLAAPGHIAQGAQPDTKPSCLQPAEDLASDAWTPEGQRERQEQDQPTDQDGGSMTLMERDPDTNEMLHNMAHRTYENPGNICFANAAAQSMLWTTLSMHTWDPTFWGEQCQALLQFCSQAPDCCFNLCNEPWFQQILRCWEARDPTFDPLLIAQQDAAEFITTWLSLLHSTAFDMRWEKRVATHDAVTMVDCGSQQTPICLKFDSILARCMTCDLTQLFNTWCQEDGMRTALTSATQCLCVQVERGIMDSQQNVMQCDCMIQVAEPCVIPVFSSAQLTYMPVEYQVVAITAHAGRDQAGHIRAALRIAPTIINEHRPANWLVTDDWQPPAPMWELPNWMRRCSNTFWLVRTDSMRLWRHRPYSLLP